MNKEIIPSGCLKIMALVVCIVAFSACYPTLKQRVTDPKKALIPIKYLYPKFQDDMDFKSLSQAIKRNLEYLDKLDSNQPFFYGPQTFTCQQVRDSQQAFLDLIMKDLDPKDFFKEIRKQFQLYRAAGRVGNKDVLFTGYFEPTYEGSLIPGETYKYPLYGRPEDLIKIDLASFHEKFKGEIITARIEENEVVPYYTRENIEDENVLKDKGLEIAWLKDPIDVTFLHIQGSGRLKLPDGETIAMGYLTANGRPYRSIGKYMLDEDFMTREEMSMQSIRSYLSSHPEVIQDVLNYNPSYVFFRQVDNGPLGNIQVTLTAGRSIALNSKLFPKGALCFISCEKPILNDQGEIESWTDFSRFVVNQDTGGAIVGSGRADIFWGNGQYAEIAAGHMKHYGQLYVLIKKTLK